MDTLYVWSVILALSLATYFNRVSFLGMLAHIELPRILKRMLAYVPAAVFAAIIAPQVFPATTTGVPTLDWPRLTAALLAIAIAIRTRSTLATICIGMLALWGMQAALG